MTATALLKQSGRPAEAAPANLTPIDLDRLNVQGALQFRMDTKYLVSADEARDLPTWFPREAGVLQIEGKREFSYLSINFDTPNLDCYRAAAFSRRRRFKVRTRAYLDSQSAFLEVKIRGRRGVT